MNAREWLSATWAEWCPLLKRGRFEVGPLIFLTRGELGRTARGMYDSGVLSERGDPGRPLLEPDPEPENSSNVYQFRRA